MAGGGVRQGSSVGLRVLRLAYQGISEFLIVVEVKTDECSLHRHRFILLADTLKAAVCFYARMMLIQVWLSLRTSASVATQSVAQLRTAFICSDN